MGQKDGRSSSQRDFLPLPVQNNYTAMLYCGRGGIWKLKKAGRAQQQAVSIYPCSRKQCPRTRKVRKQNLPWRRPELALRGKARRRPGKAAWRWRSHAHGREPWRRHSRHTRRRTHRRWWPCIRHWSAGHGGWHATGRCSKSHASSSRDTASWSSRHLQAGGNENNHTSVSDCAWCDERRHRQHAHVPAAMFSLPAAALRRSS